MNRELISKKDYEILGIKENSKPEEINSAYEKLVLEYHPEKIKLEKLREPDEFELKKYAEIEKVYKKFDLEHPKYKCGGRKGLKPCTNMFYPCLWEKIEDGHSRLFCSQECYNGEYKSSYDDLIEKWKNEDAGERKKKLAEAKKSLVDWKRSELRDIENELRHAKISKEDLEPENRNYEQEINSITIKDEEDQEWISKISDIERRVSKDISSKSKRDLQTCDYCKKSFKGEWDEKSHGYVSYGATGKDGHYTFCSEECREKGMKGKWFTTARKNPFAELLKWMKKEGIANINLDPSSNKLILKFSNNQEKIIEDENLTAEQREIKEFLHQIGKNGLSQDQVKQEVEKEKKKGGNNWLGPAAILAVVALVIILVGVIIYKNRTKHKVY